MSPKRLVPLLIFTLIALFSLAPMVVHGQGTLVYGSGVTGEISAVAPLAFYSFSGSANDHVSVRVIGITPGFSPAVSLNNPAQQQIASSGGDPSSSSGSDSVRVDGLLAQNGVYTVLVSSLGGTPGQFLIRLDGQQVPASFPLTNAPATVGINEQTPAQSFTFTADPSASSTITLQGDSPFGVSVTGANGVMVASLSQITLPAVSFTVPAGSETYTVFVYGVGGTQGTVNAQIGGAGESTASQQPSIASNPPANPNECSAVPAGAGTNVRSGPGTNYPVVGQLSSSVVTGYYGEWYAIYYGGSTAWVYSSVVNTSGPCGNLPYVEAPPAPAAQDTGSQPPPPQTSEEAAPPTQNTGGESPPPQNQPTVEPTQSSVQTAPPDSDYRFDVDRDNGGTFSQVVSYPEGDNRDRIDVYLNLAQLSPNNARNVNITISCSGPGSEYLAFTRSSPNAQRYTCGQTISYRYAHPYGTQPYYVFLDGGSGAYVNYTLTATTSQ